MGRLHASAIERSGQLTLVGVIDPGDPGWSVPWSRDGLDLLGEVSAQAVIVAVPPQSHFEVANACLEAGCHVLLEKPICPQGSRARELSRRFREAGRVLFGGHSERFHPVFRAFSDRLAEVGEVRSIRCERVGPAPEKTPVGGALLDLGIHDLDLLERLWGAAVWDRARCWGPQGVVAEGSTASGIGVELRCGYAPSRRRQWFVETSHALWSLDFAEVLLEFREGDQARRVPLPLGDPLELEHAAFLDACLGNGQGEDLESQLSAVEQVERIATLL